jgi:hypothetical protein
MSDCIYFIENIQNANAKTGNSIDIKENEASIFETINQNLAQEHSSPTEEET